MMASKPAALLLACLVVSACGLTAPRSNPGFADLESPGLFDTDRQFAMSLGRTVLRFAASHMDDDPETQALLRSLDGVRLRVYEIDGDPARVARKMDNMQAHLRDDGWEPVMLFRSEGETTHLLLKSVAGQVLGLTLLSSDGDSEAVVINLIGEIQPQSFSDVMVALDINEGGAQRVEVAMIDGCNPSPSSEHFSPSSSRSAAAPALPSSPTCDSRAKSSPSKSRTPRRNSSSD